MPTTTQHDPDETPTEKTAETDELTIRPTGGADGAAMWRLARDSGSLDLNASYTYLLLARHFGTTCRVALLGEKAVGYVLGYRPPERPGSLFIWQVAVSSDARGRGLAGRMIQDVLDDHPDIGALEATVTESNLASRALFEGIARRHDASLTWRPFIREEDFPDGHEAEPMLEISPLSQH
ncbi:diaminobutyrate acetyltransferase [Georgenia halophila]